MLTHVGAKICSSFEARVLSVLIHLLCFIRSPPQCCIMPNLFMTNLGCCSVVRHGCDTHSTVSDCNLKYKRACFYASNCTRLLISKRTRPGYQVFTQVRVSAIVHVCVCQTDRHMVTRSVDCSGICRIAGGKSFKATARGRHVSSATPKRGIVTISKKRICFKDPFPSLADKT